MATLHISYRSVKSHFTTENDKEFPHSMKIKLVDGPFRRLEGLLAFQGAGRARLQDRVPALHYDFSSRMFEKVIGPVFSHIANTFVDAFVRRADEVHGAANG